MAEVDPVATLDAGALELDQLAAGFRDMSAGLQLLATALRDLSADLGDELPPALSSPERAARLAKVLGAAHYIATAAAQLTAPMAVLCPMAEKLAAAIAELTSS